VANRGPAPLLTDREIPDLVDSQVAQFAIESMQATWTRSFDPRAMLQTLGTTGETELVAIDIGGDSMTARLAFWLPRWRR
jgi:hypothetical protein